MKLNDKKKTVAAKMGTKDVAKRREEWHSLDFSDARAIWGKSKQKGKGALNIPKSKTGKNEGNTMYEGKNEQERM